MKMKTQNYKSKSTHEIVNSSYLDVGLGQSPERELNFFFIIFRLLWVLLNTNTDVNCMYIK